MCSRVLEASRSQCLQPSWREQPPRRYESARTKSDSCESCEPFENSLACVDVPNRPELLAPSRKNTTERCVHRTRTAMGDVVESVHKHFVATRGGRAQPTGKLALE